MNYEGVKTHLLWYMTHSGERDEITASEIYHDDALLEFPQSGERFRGKDNFIPWRSEYPAVRLEFELRSIRGEGDMWIAEGTIRYDDGDPVPFVDMLHYRGELVDHETIYVTEPFPAADARAKYAESSALDTTPGLPLRVPSQPGETGSRS